VYVISLFDEVILLKVSFNSLEDEEARGSRREGTEHLNVHASEETLQTVNLDSFP
jgi:hypothetical protein